MDSCWVDITSACQWCGQAMATNGRQLWCINDGCGGLDELDEDGGE